MFTSGKESDYQSKNECFKWAITRALNPVEEHSERIDKILREKSKVFNLEGLKFPVNLIDINKF